MTDSVKGTSYFKLTPSFVSLPTASTPKRKAAGIFLPPCGGTPVHIRGETSGLHLKGPCWAYTLWDMVTDRWPLTSRGSSCIRTARHGPEEGCRHQARGVWPRTALYVRHSLGLRCGTYLPSLPLFEAWWQHCKSSARCTQSQPRRFYRLLLFWQHLLPIQPPRLYWYLPIRPPLLWRQQNIPNHLLPSIPLNELSGEASCGR